MQRIVHASRPLGRLIASQRPKVCRGYASVASKHSWRPTRQTAVLAVTGLAATTAYTAWNLATPVYAEAPTNSFAGSNISFPIFLNHGTEWKRLIGLGARQVSFLNINVYVLGLYMRSQDIGALKQIQGWKNFDKASFLEKEDMALSLLKAPFDLSIRVVPVRATNTQHLRDGFTRSLLQRMRAESKDMSEDEERNILDGIKEFKGSFANANIKKDTEFIFTKTADGELVIEYEGKLMGTVKNKWVATNFMMGYLNPTKPASELARQNIAEGFEKILDERSA
ncbi:chalcone-flavanone isomerase-domain-containing protein [Phycomyces nitens]|nr:chalcone-flavanone isomerase-domain-containing protein [Phycomyces nitens]